MERPGKSRMTNQFLRDYNIITNPEMAVKRRK